MKIAIIGYGKMGREIEAVALARNHTIPVVVDVNNLHDLESDTFRQCDVAIEFTTPHTVTDNLYRCFQAGVPVVTGSTGWHDRLEEVSRQCNAAGQALFYASNFSLGVNIFFKINELLASLMAPYDSYDVSMEETHHTQKLDAPSGTALTLAGPILEKLERKRQWVAGVPRSSDDLSICSIRRDSVPGIHTITYESPEDMISITHNAKNRKGLAQGAVLAAEFLAGRKGVYTMSDLLNF